MVRFYFFGLGESEPGNFLLPHKYATDNMWPILLNMIRFVASTLARFDY